MYDILPLFSFSSRCLARCASSSALRSSSVRFRLRSTSASSRSRSSMASLARLRRFSSRTRQAASSASGSRPSVVSTSESEFSSSSQCFLPAARAARSFRICSSTSSSAAFCLAAASARRASSSDPSLLSASFPRWLLGTNFGRIINLLGASCSSSLLLSSSDEPLSSSEPSSCSLSSSVMKPSSAASFSAVSASILRFGDGIVLGCWCFTCSERLLDGKSTKHRAITRQSTISVYASGTCSVASARKAHRVFGRMYLPTNASLPD